MYREATGEVFAILNRLQDLVRNNRPCERPSQELFDITNRHKNAVLDGEIPDAFIDDIVRIIYDVDPDTIIFTAATLPMAQCVIMLEKIYNRIGDYLFMDTIYVDFCAIVYVLVDRHPSKGCLRWDALQIDVRKYIETNFEMS